MATARLSRIRVRMYQVGFGDCFLVSFEYDGALPDGRNERQVLIDFGSRRLGAGARSLQPIARKIAEHSGGRLDVVVVTHRHQDHLSAFGQAGVSHILAPSAPPTLVVRSWTEDPSLAADATGPGSGPAAAPGAAAAGPTGPGGEGSTGPGPDSIRFLRTLRRAREFSEALTHALAGAPRSQVGDQLRVMAAGQLANANAVHVLEDWANAGRGTYLFYGAPSGIEDVVPGLAVTVLGPPTVEQHPPVTTQREADPEEFWMLYRGLVQQARPRLLLRALTRAGSMELTGDDAGTEGPADAEGRPDGERASGQGVGPIGPVRWLTDRMGRQQLNSFLRITRIMDDVLNNTSVILLFEAQGPTGPVRMLFPGDAQIENWEYALKFATEKDDNLARLGQVDLYKVGHHGSRNATPRSLFDAWVQPANRTRAMTALMSTKTDVFGKTEATAVPRQTLVDALAGRTTLYSTTTLRTPVAWHEVVADLSAGASFGPVPPGS